MRVFICAAVGVALAVAGCSTAATNTVDEKKVTEAAPLPGPMDPGGVAVQPYRPVDPMPTPAPAPAPEVINIGPAPDPGVPAPPAVGRTYTVQKGDTLYSISAKVYGFATAHDKNIGAGKIYEANKTAIGPDRDKLRAGMKLTIPAKPEVRTADAGAPASKSTKASATRKR
jgi:Tfp pilus assembly protein FimV